MREISAEDNDLANERPNEEQIMRAESIASQASVSSISVPMASNEPITRKEASVRPKQFYRAPEVVGEERLESDALLLPCVVCGASIAGRPALVSHLEERHSQRICPICSLPFDSRVSGHEDYFRMHVENHLENGYPLK